MTVANSATTNFAPNNSDELTTEAVKEVFYESIPKAKYPHRSRTHLQPQQTHSTTNHYLPMLSRRGSHQKQSLPVLRKAIPIKFSHHDLTQGLRPGVFVVLLKRLGYQIQPHGKSASQKRDPREDRFEHRVIKTQHLEPVMLLKHHWLDLND
jgi:hypothetical protein